MRDLRKALGISAGTLYGMQQGTFPPQIHIGSLARWKKSDIDGWLHNKTEARAHKTLAAERPQATHRVRGGRSRWAATTASTPEIAQSHIRNWEPRPTPLRGSGHRLAPGVPKPVAPDHPDYTVPRYRLEDAAGYMGLMSESQWDLIAIPHGRTRAMHYCFAQSDLDEFKATVRPPRKRQKVRDGESRS